MNPDLLLFWNSYDNIYHQDNYMYLSNTIETFILAQNQTPQNREKKALRDIMSILRFFTFGFYSAK